MTDLTIIYSKTPKGLRARASLVGGLSSHLMKVLSHVDGTSKAEDILLKFDHLSPETLLSELAQLEKEGYIKVSGNTRPNQEWSPTVHFTPMVVEEYQSEEELEEIARAKAEQEAKLAADRKANAEAAAQREKERKSQEEKALIEAKSRAKAEAKMKEILEAEAREAEELRIKAELEAKAKEEEEKAKLAQEKAELAAKKAQEEAELAKAKAEAREIAIKDAARKEKEAEELRIKAELEAKAIEEEKAKKAQEEAELAKAKAEAEAREIALKEAASKAKEAEDLRIKAEQEAKAKEAEALRIKAEQEAQAREEAARLAKEEAKLKAEEAKQAKLKEKEKEKQKAHVEIERVLKEAEEKRKKLAKKAKEEKLEAKRNAKAEEDRIKAERIKAESKSKEEVSLLRTTLAAEEKANQAEKEAQRVAIEKIAQEAEEKRVSHLENAAEIAEVQTNTDETRLKELLDEEEREKAANKEKSRLEMERIAEEANALRKPATILKFPKTKKGKQAPEATKATDEESMVLAKMEERARREAERLAEEEAELAEIEAEEAAQKKSKGFTKTEVKPEKIDTIETIKATKPEKIEKLEKLKIPINLAWPEFKFPTKLLKSWLAGLAKLIFMYLPLTLVLLIGIAHFINLKMLVSPIENLMSESINDAVSIQEVRVSLLPEPHLILGKVSIGQATNLNIGSIYVVPTRESIFEDVKVVKSAVIEDVKINHDGFNRSLQWINALAASERLKVDQINLKNLTVKIRDLELGAFDGELKLSASKMVDSIALMSADHTLKINILNTNGINNLILDANNWTLPLQSKLLITQLKARGVANQEGINFDNLNGELYGGTIQSKVKINWATGWQAFGSIDLNGVSASPFLGSLNSPTLVEGKLNLTGNFSSKSSQSNGLIDNADMNADFVINHGSITGVELTRAVIAHGSQTLMGEDTHFDKLSGNLQVKSGMYQYRKVVLQSPQFRASAYFDVMPNQILSGKVSANLQAQSRNLQSNFALEGTSNNVRSK